MNFLHADIAAQQTAGSYENGVERSSLSVYVIPNYVLLRSHLKKMP